MVNFVLFITILLISTVGFSQSFTNYKPAPNASSWNANAITDLYINGSDVVCYTRGDSVLATYNNGTWSYNGKLAHGFASTGSSSSELEMDANGDFWIAYFYKLDVFNGSTVTTLTASTSDLKNDYVKDLVIDNNAVKYIGYANGFGVSKVENGTWTHKGSFTGNFSDLNSIFVPRYMELNKATNDVWITTADKFIKINNNTLTTYTSTGTDIPYNSGGKVTGMTVTDNGTVWFSLESNSNDPTKGGIVSFDGSTWTHYNTSNSNIPSNDITAITSYQNQIIFNNYSINGLTVLSNGTWTTYNNTNTNLATSFHAHEMKTLGDKIYVGTNGGLLIFDLGAIANIDNKKDIQYILYPNPTNGFVNIKGLAHNNQNQRVEITTLEGKLVWEQKSNERIDISNFPNGIYTLNILNNNKIVYSEKVVKQ